MIRALHAEWTKLRTMPGNAWCFLGVVGVTVTLSVAFTASVDVGDCATPQGCHEDTTKLALSGTWLGQAAVVVLAALVITNEHGTRMIHTTLAATPRRAVVLLAKAAVVAGVVLAAAVLGVAGSLLTGRFFLEGNGFTAANGYPPLSLATEPTLRAAAGTVLYLVLVGVLSLGAGALLRDTAGTITGVLSLFYLVPIAVQFVGDPRWRERLEKAAPTAGMAVQATRDLDRLPIGPWAGLGVLAAYAAAILLAGGAAFIRRDP
ncbi:ABC transporter permease [Spirillospora sp. NPDC048911]|uniref:ABC transporter permease n=1 Tax=Spirillospora sp. NPDC048911 TaxID=3364527 RepID=UPI003720D6E7